eukprot:GHVU01207862.1.p1 GENE.GHVU01207862.1~~GHVU01207862.1.p1  ORF type:complete len:120 (-),score=3.69 GHVU01207862.1:492-851(-)
MSLLSWLSAGTPLGLFGAAASDAAAAAIDWPRPPRLIVSAWLVRCCVNPQFGSKQSSRTTGGVAVAAVLLLYAALLVIYLCESVGGRVGGSIGLTSGPTDGLAIAGPCERIGSREMDGG